MTIEVNDFRNKSEKEVFNMYKEIALKDYIYDELCNITINNEEMFYNINDKEKGNEEIKKIYNINNEEKNSEE